MEKKFIYNYININNYNKIYKLIYILLKLKTMFKINLRKINKLKK